jgi:hypothetical protein
MKRFSIAMLFLALTMPALAKDFLTINSTPPGATVEIDQIVVGKTPYIKEIPGGFLHGTKSVFGKTLGHNPHLRLLLDGYETKEVDLATGPYPWIALNGIQHGEYYILKSATFNFTLDVPQSEPVPTPEVGTGKVTVQSNTTTAEVYVDGKFIGSVPSTLTLSVGTHTIEVKDPESNKSWKRDVEVMLDSDVIINAMTK